VDRPITGPADRVTGRVRNFPESGPIITAFVGKCKFSNSVSIEKTAIFSRFSNKETQNTALGDLRAENGTFGPIKNSKFLRALSTFCTI